MNRRSVLVFTRTKHRANLLVSDLEGIGFKVGVLHANKSQNARKAALDGFRNGKLEILVATDIAARGIDVAAISHVINYDIPDTAETYIHRIGRTGRAEQQGDAITFISDEDMYEVKAIEKKLGKPVPRKKHPTFNYDMKDVSSLQGGAKKEFPRDNQRSYSEKAKSNFSRNPSKDFSRSSSGKKDFSQQPRKSFNRNSERDFSRAPRENRRSYPENARSNFARNSSKDFNASGAGKKDFSRTSRENFNRDSDNSLYSRSKREDFQRNRNTDDRKRSYVKPFGGNKFRDKR
jgi:ATP-dependent RNA helicase RhlE